MPGPSDLCSSCQAPLPADSLFCPKCGTASSVAPTMRTGDVSAPAAAPTDALLIELQEALAPQIQVVGELGSGGMGTVFLGRDPTLKRSVAIKVLNPDLAHDAAARTRFAREAEAAAAVGHPNVVAIYQVGTLPRSGASFFVMQFVEGETLSQAYPPGTPAPVAQVRRIVGEVASALAAAHARGLVHRDIKPANVMIDRATGRTVVLDFGISAVLEGRGPQTEPRLTATGSSLGTPTYMSPEQASAEPVTGQTDVYSLGCLAFELLAGRPPFVEASAWAVMAAHIKEAPPRLLQFRSDTDPEFADLVDRCLRKAPAERPTSAVIARQLLPPTSPSVEWPPPGLGTLHRSGVRLLASLATSGLAAAAHALLAAAPPAGRSLGDEFGVVYGTFSTAGAHDVWSLALLVTRVGWGVAVLLVLALGVGLGRRVASALRSGYPLRVAFAVAFDLASDTSAMLNGEPPYADLDGAAREQARRWRMRAAVSVAAAALLANVTPFVWLTGSWPGSTGAGHPYALDVTMLLGPVLLLAVAAGYCARRGGGRRRRTRALFHAREELRPRPEVVRGWLASRGVAATASGPVRSTAIGLALTTVAVLVSLCAGLAGSVLAFITMATTQYGYDTRRSLVYQCGVSYERCGDRQLPGESALSRLAGIPVAPTPSTEAVGFVVGLLAPRSVGSDEGPFVRGTRSATRIPADPTRTRRAWAYLPGPLPAPLRDSLALDASDPHLYLWRAFAATRPADRWWPYDSLFRGATGLWSLEASAGVGDVARQNEAAAVLAAAARDTARSSRRLRENLSAALNLLMVPVLSVRRRGSEEVRATVHALRELARVSGDSAYAGLARAVEATRRYAVPLFPNVGVFVETPGTPQLLGVVRDTLRDPFLRYGLVAGAAHSGFCYSAREMLFGVSPARAEDVRRLAALAPDLPRMAAFAELNLRALDVLRTDVTALVEASGATPTFAAVDRLDAVGLRGPAARVTYCFDVSWY